METTNPIAANAPDETSFPEEQMALLRPLTGKQQQFVIAYVGEARFSQTKAAKIAGYANPNNEIWRLMNDPDIKKAIEAFLAPQVMGAKEILARFDEQSRLNVTDFFDFVKPCEANNWKQIVFNPEKAESSGKMHLIKGFEYSKSGDLQIVFRDPDASLTLLGKHYKLFVERVEHSGNIDLSGFEDDELERLAAGKSLR